MFASFNPGHVGINVPLETGLALAERHGFSGYDASLDVLHLAVTQQGAMAVRDLFLARGLRVGAWNLPFMPYAGSEVEWREWLAKLPAFFASAAAVGARRASMWILPGSNDRAYEENVDHHVARFQPFARLLADQGIRLALEFVGPETSLRAFTHPFVRTIPATLELARAIGPNCGLLLDSWHWHCIGGTRADLAALTREQVVHVHVNDAPVGVPVAELQDMSRKLPCTTGVLDLEGFMQALANAGYDGPVTAEPFDATINALPVEEAAAITAKTTRTTVALGVRTEGR